MNKKRIEEDVNGKPCSVSLTLTRDSLGFVTVKFSLKRNQVETVVEKKQQNPNEKIREIVKTCREELIEKVQGQYFGSNVEVDPLLSLIKRL